MRLISVESRSNVPFHESTLRNEIWVTEEFLYSIVGSSQSRDVIWR